MSFFNLYRLMVSRSQLNFLVTLFQSLIHLLVIELSPQVTVPLLVTNRQPTQLVNGVQPPLFGHPPFWVSPPYEVANPPFFAAFFSRQKHIGSLPSGCYICMKIIPILWFNRLNVQKMYQSSCKLTKTVHSPLK